MTTDASLYCSHAHGCDGKATARPQTACDSPPAPKRPASTCARSRSPQTRTTLKGVGGKAAVGGRCSPSGTPIACALPLPLPLPHLQPPPSPAESPHRSCRRSRRRCRHARATGLAQPHSTHTLKHVADARPGACPMSRRSGAREVGRDDESGATVAAFTCHHHASESELH